MYRKIFAFLSSSSSSDGPVVAIHRQSSFVSIDLSVGSSSFTPYNDGLWKVNNEIAANVSNVESVFLSILFVTVAE